MGKSRSVAIVSTYGGETSTGYQTVTSGNVGDHLISSSVRSLISKHGLEDLEVRQVFRLSRWQEVESIVSEADLIVFASLAVRPRLAKITYPYLDRILKSDESIAILSAGTALPIHFDKDPFSHIDKESVMHLT